jgi:hypothetical protein
LPMSGGRPRGLLRLRSCSLAVCDCRCLEAGRRKDFFSIEEGSSACGLPKDFFNDEDCIV